jgi:uncharacterized membrane protein
MSITADSLLPHEAHQTRRVAPTRLLGSAARTWFITALVGQLVFSLYITIVYGRAAIGTDPELWNLVMPRGYVAGDRVGNTAVVLHVFLALVIIIGGATQLMPAVRRRAPALHRWTGRMYMIAIALTSLLGLYMVWVRGAVGDLWQHIAISLNAVILCTCGALAWRTARARNVAAHREWGLRMYLAANGVFFFRLALFLWLLINQGPVGFDADTFSGPFLTTLAFAVYVFLPISILELYFSAQRSRQPRRQRLTAALIFALSLLTAGGVAAASLIIWIPRMRG